jgi:hypothetical protein
MRPDRSGAEFSASGAIAGAARRQPGDAAGFPAQADGRLRLLEGFRAPPELDQARFPDVSINSYVFSLDALAQPVQLADHGVRKQVDGQPVLQLERVTCEATEASRANGSPLLPLSCLRVPREGPPTDFFAGRFYPVKERAALDGVPEHLANSRPQGQEEAAVTQVAAAAGQRSGKGLSPVRVKAQRDRLEAIDAVPAEVAPLRSGPWRAARTRGGARSARRRPTACGRSAATSGSAP